ncbi:hypothetical protein ASU33_15275 [Solirubrum puertoriconensis]|uniref:Cellulose synthase n=2 Tax=Solirubrum puertoriconensis TaxID=1751427 RepID=A0A9X0HKQ8_SOLP1|nr:hypothetical protein ASU33_15275 [Solirubrum puertoriconensis]
MRLLIILGVAALLYFLIWFIDPAHVGYRPLFWLLTISLGFKVLRTLHEWVHYAGVSLPVPPDTLPASTAPQLRVDMLTTACPGEPRDMVARTLRAMQRVRYPHTSYLCDEGNDPWLRALCEELGVVHVTRTEKIDAKAGNINNALRQATGDICVVLDPDHVPTPDFLDEVLPYFADPTVGFVQVVQAYGNQHESLVARGAAEQTYHFYGPLMMGMHRYGTAMAIGANCTFRRAALDSIGGHAAGLTEDMHTAMRLHAAGWRSVYVPKVVSRGLVPSSLGAFYAQQLKWARGSFELLFRVYPKLFSRFSFAQKLHYLTLPLYFLSGIISLIDIAVPLLCLFTARFPWYVSLPQLALHAAPLLLLSVLIRLYAQRWLREPHESGMHLVGGILRVGTWWVYSLGFIYALLKVRVPYIPTPKEGTLKNELKLALPNLLVAALSVVAVKYARIIAVDKYTNVLAGLVLLNAAILTVAAFMGQHRMLHNLVTDMAQRPYRQLVLALERLQAWFGHRLPLLLRRQMLPLAAVMVLVIIGGPALYRFALDQKTGAPRWIAAGPASVVTGRVVASTGTEGLNRPVSENFVQQPSTNQIVALDYACTPAELPWVLAEFAERPEVPMITLQVSGYETPATWQRVAEAVQSLGQPVLLKPLLPYTTPSTYRDNWRTMVKSFRKAEASNVSWVWSAPHPDSLLAYMPGAAYLNWVAIDCLRPDDAASIKTVYEPYRQQIGACLELHPKPVLLLAAQQPRGSRAEQANALASLYPEVRAVVFTPYLHPESIAWRQLALPAASN